ncbi:MAG: pyridoxamine 5'-phosphate oxidase [Geminicoccaceae bacterium]|jgi:putative heme iron utilization protein|nr:MAG: pyridoxamine 5'-phosphate oxidase [Geminicoccaceae bacterium]
MDAATQNEDPGFTIRRLLREQPRAALGTLLGETGEPYVSLAMVTVDHDAEPVLLISDLADHTRNIRRDPRVSLLFDGTAGLAVALTGARASVQGRAVCIDGDERLAKRYVAHHPDAELYLGFKDFHLFKVRIEKAHLVAGFGRIHWVEGEKIRFDTSGTAALAAAEAEIVAHMNEDHADAVQLYAERLLGRTGGGWKLTGVDPEGADLRREGETARLWFDKPVHDAESCRVELVRLVKRARAMAQEVAAGTSG